MKKEIHDTRDLGTIDNTYKKAKANIDILCKALRDTPDILFEYKNKLLHQIYRS